jgi:predicted esterase
MNENIMETMRELNVPITTHGRVLVDDPDEPGPLRLLVGFHGYGQNADEMLEMLRSIPDASSWTRASVQALHRFYRGRSATTTVASWMTRQDRDILIADNLAYVDTAVTSAIGERRISKLVYCGFSQGVAMAFRAAVRGTTKPDAVLALGADVPPELLADERAVFPRVLLARGTRDEFYDSEKFKADHTALSARGVDVENLTFDGGHEWHAEFGRKVSAILAEL